MKIKKLLRKKRGKVVKDLRTWKIKTKNRIWESLKRNWNQLIKKNKNKNSKKIKKIKIIPIQQVFYQFFIFQSL